MKVFDRVTIVYPGQSGRKFNCVVLSFDESNMTLDAIGHGEDGPNPVTGQPFLKNEEGRFTGISQEGSQIEGHPYWLPS